MNKGVSHQEESSSSKGRYDRDSEPRVKRSTEVDKHQERSPCRKCEKHHGEECMTGSKSCYICRKSGHMMKDFPYMRGREKGQDKVQLNGPSGKAPRMQLFPRTQV